VEGDCGDDIQTPGMLHQDAPFLDSGGGLDGWETVIWLDFVVQGALFV
jgi:hypothetical protein